MEIIIVIPLVIIALILLVTRLVIGFHLAEKAPKKLNWQSIVGLIILASVIVYIILSELN